VKVKCQNCGKSLIKHQKKFCSRSCSVSKNNTKPRNRLKPSIETLKKYGECSKCKCSLDHKQRRTLCENCKNIQDVTLEESIYDKHHTSSAYALVRSRARKIAKDLGMKKCENCGYNKHHTSSAYALVRSRARKIAKDLGMKKCENCGYNKHVEIAHKKAISTFDKSTLLSEINHPSNLIALCPNCHWEFDNLK